MPRSSATPTIKLGPFISCKVGANPAVEKVAGFNNICDNGHDPVRTRQVVGSAGGRLECPTCHGGPTGKGRETAAGIVKVPDAELEAAREEAKAFKNVVNLNVHPVVQMTKMLPAPEGKVYMLHPHEASQADTYQLLLHEVRTRTDLCFTAMWAVSTVPAPYRLQEYSDRLVLVELAQPAAIKELPAVGGTLNPAYAPMADAVVNQLVTDFDPDTYRNTGRERLEAVIAAATAAPAAGGGPGTPVPAQGDPLLAALQAAVLAAGATPITAAPSAAPTAQKATA